MCDSALIEVIQVNVFLQPSVSYHMAMLYDTATNHPGRISIVTGFPPSPEDVAGLDGDCPIDQRI